ncbi:MAG: ABC transporter permease [Bacteroidetes bacterium]|nr:ABC transporter permease [Bacteroidota bacterium]
MIKNYLKVALRNILKQKFFSVINLSGLVIGMTCCLLIFIYVADELSYDKFHKGYEDIYRVALHGKIAGQEITTTTTCIPLGPAMKAEIPGVEEYVRVMPVGYSTGVAFRYEQKSFTENNIFYSDSNFFQFFTFKLVQGDPAKVLKDPNSIVLTEAMAKKYFGDEDPIGKTLVIGVDKKAIKVTGVAAPAPSNSHFHYNAVISYITVEKEYFQGWTGNSIQTYFRKTSATETASINKKLEDMVEKYVGKELQEGLGVSLETFRKQGGIYSYYVYPMADSHLYAGLGDDLEPNGDIRYVYIFAGVGAFILLLACINFMNLSTARSAGRAKEVGLRKTLGSLRTQMMAQFLSESFIYSFAAVIISVGLGFLALPYFNLLTAKTLDFSALISPWFVIATVGLIILVGLISGSYPAFYLTSFSPIEVLRGKVRAGMKSKGVRSSLVVFQFAISTFLIIATMVVYQQLTYMQSRDLGLDKNGVVTITGMRRLGTNMSAFKTSADNIAGVASSSFTNNRFPGMDNTTVVREKGKESDHLVGLYYADWDHLDVMKIQMKEGRFFSREFKSDTLAAVINEAAVHEYGLTNPIGTELVDFNGEKPTTVKVVGVLKDFNFETLKREVRPVVMRLTNEGRFLSIRYNGDADAVVKDLENLWKTMAPGEPFEYQFLDQSFDSLFRSEMRLRDIFTLFSGLAIFIACMGLFALAAFSTEQRTKEIGVRKAMGASAYSLTVLLSTEFTRLVLIAIVPAVALGWFVANWWLKDFAFRTELSPLIFVGSAAIAILIAWLTISFQSVKAAATNPVKSLRYE